jgi:uncharacterized protein (DUF2252 family)
VWLEGVALRGRQPIETIAAPTRRPADADDPVTILTSRNQDRIANLLPLRFGRMAASPFAFLRGAAAVMASDLARGPDTGLYGQICGDAHAANFGFYASPERRLILDVNDFDETVAAPWEWDLKRLVASLVCAGRTAGIPEPDCRAAAGDCAAAYRHGMVELARMPHIAAHYLTTEHVGLTNHGVDDLVETFARVVKKARKNTANRVIKKSTSVASGGPWRFVEDHDRWTRLPQTEVDRVIAGLGQYRKTLGERVRALVDQYAVVDVAHRVVGLGSIGLRSYVVLLRGNGDDALVIQVKQARPSALAPYLPDRPAVHEGERIVRGQRWMQTVSDILLGWTTIDGRPYLVRQFRDMKAGIDPVTLSAAQFDDYARVVGVLLARAHARSIDPRILAGYCQGRADAVDGVSADACPDADPVAGRAFDAAMTRYAVAYADQTEADHQALVHAIRSGRLPAQVDGGPEGKPGGALSS